MTKTSKNNDVTDHIGVVYTENYIELSGSTKPSTVYTKTRQDNNLTDLIDTVYAKKEIELSRLTRLSFTYDENQIGQCCD